MEEIQAAIAKARAARGELLLAPTVETIAAPDAAEGAWTALPGFTPDRRRLEDRHVVTLAGDRAAAPFDALRTKLVQHMRANNWRRLAITSPTPSCGKSTITLNLGFSLARQPEFRTIIAELDLRRPSLAGTLGLKTGHSFAKVLEGKADLAGNAVRYGDNLILSTNAGISRNPAELLLGSGVSTVLSGIEARYAPDMMIFDMPPMLVSDDTMAFMGQVDCVLLVAASETTTVKEVDTCERELASQTNVLGVILNKCRYIGSEYGYSYYG